MVLQSYQLHFLYNQDYPWKKLIQWFQNIHHKLTLSDLYVNEVGHNDDNSYVSNDDWNDKDKPDQDKNLVANTDFDKDKLEHINDMSNEDELHFNDG